MPSRCAVRFISSAKSSTEPDTPSASTTAMSFADFTISILRALSTVTCVPAGKPIFDGCCAAAFGETVSGVRGDQAPLLHRAQRHIGGHHLGDRGRIPRIGGVLGVQDLAAVGLDHSSASAKAGGGAGRLQRAEPTTAVDEQRAAVAVGRQAESARSRSALVRPRNERVPGGSAGLSERRTRRRKAKQGWNAICACSDPC